MDNLKNKIISDLYKSKDVDFIMSYIPERYRSDLKQYAFEKLLELDSKKIRSINIGNGLLNYFKRIIYVQWNYERPKNKGFMKEWRGGMETTELNDNIIIIEESKENDERDDVLNLLDDKIYMKDLLDRFFEMNSNSVNYFFNRVVFELYYFDRMTLTQISKETDIGYESIRKSVNFTLQFVRTEILKEIKID